MEVTRPNVRQECVTWREDVYFPTFAVPPLFFIILFAGRIAIIVYLMDGSTSINLELGEDEGEGGNSARWKNIIKWSCSGFNPRQRDAGTINERQSGMRCPALNIHNTGGKR
ncbi:hypothetical protein JTE90_005802 [Oedothorax gibbosus]|uniref:Uncharacterized protein n=1 Tax=Oedothorax gibbosus TaxID=931172 RepID=A0AAV6U8V7_9ARAC|nr:hypothetical protein JTE90_005802 [Oedothorax gibbosus]